METNKSNDFELMQKKQNRMYRIFYPIVRFFFYLVHPLKIYGRENIPDGGALVCPNHTSLSDPLIVMFAFKGKSCMRAMAKQELLDVPLLGKFLGSAGVFGVKRGAADVSAIKMALRYLKGGDKVIMFPEGHRASEGEDLDAKNGVAMIALKAGVPIVPVYVQPKKRWFRFTKVSIGVPWTPHAESKRPTAADYHQIGVDWKENVRALEAAL